MIKYNDTKMFYEINEQPAVLAKLEPALKESLAKIKDEMKKRNITAITLAARGSSDNACAYFKYMCEIYAGIPCTLAAPGVYTMYNGKLKIENNLLIAVSQSGKAADVMEVMNKAKAAGSLVVAITNDEQSPMAKLSDIHLFLNAEKEESVAATKTFTAQAYTLGLLAAYLAGDNEVLTALRSVPEKVAEVVNNAAAVSETAKLLKDTKDAFVLARGLNYGAALECALKMQETTYTKAKAYSVSDFQHGPFAMIDENATVILLAPEGESFPDMKEMLDKCNAMGAKTLVFTSGGELKGSLATLNIPASPDAVSPILNVVTQQLLVNALSTLRGLNPDAPRGLNKVTITK